MSVAANPIDQRTRAMSGLAHRMKCARISLDLTQEQLAERLGIARQTLTGYEKGHTAPPRAFWRNSAKTTTLTLSGFCWALGVGMRPKMATTNSAHLKPERSRADGYR